MASECIQACCSTNRDVPDEAPKPYQDCRDVIHIAIFFDGTGNNDYIDGASKKWSNVARMYFAAKLAAQADRSSTSYPIYVAGVGTKFNGRAADRIAAASAWVEDGFPGAGSGAGGSRRMEYAGDMVNEQLRTALIANASLLGGRVAKYADENRQKSFGELNAALARHRLVKVVNLSIFGFSRGAALARAFSNLFIKKCELSDESLIYQGFPARINFMGVFDTVASFGVPAQNARTPFTERELIVSRLVERCAHFIAAHELRFSFPVDLIQKNGKLAGNWIEKVYPGVHSDVGGGYEPHEQGVDNNYARIPMRDMMKEAVLHGARMLSYDEIRKRAFPIFADRFECRPETEKAYRSYMAACSGTGAIEEQVKGHLRLYYSAHGTMHRKGITSVGERRREANKLKYIFGSKGMAFEVKLYRTLVKAGEWLRLEESTARGFAQYLEIKDWQLAAWETNSTQSTMDFFSHYVHDSKVDFMGNIEPFTYFRPRGLDESSISIWTEGGNWIQNKVGAVNGVARSVAQTGKERATKVVVGTAAIVERATDAVQRSASEATRTVKDGAGKAVAKANDAYSAVAASGKQVASKAGKKAHELGRGVEEVYENGIRWTKREIDRIADFFE